MALKHSKNLRTPALRLANLSNNIQFKISQNKHNFLPRGKLIAIIDQHKENSLLLLFVSTDYITESHCLQQWHKALTSYCQK